MKKLSTKNLPFRINRLLRKKAEKKFPRIAFKYKHYRGEVDSRIEYFCNLLWYDDSIINKNILSNNKKALINASEKVCRHEFSLLGSNHTFKDEIDWHYDFKYNVRHCNHNVYLNFLYYDQAVQSDIKVPLELSRFNHAVTLGLGWQISQDEKYCIEYVKQVTSWINNNKVGLGVNWSYAMDSAIRAVNWLVAFGLMYDCLIKEEYREFREKFILSLWGHGCFISTHLEWLGVKTVSGANHLISDLSGLFALGLLFRESSKGNKWLKLAHENLEFQMNHQVLPDGVHFERSISYHRLVLEMFLWCGKLAQKANIPFSDLYYKKTKKMQAFVIDYINADGTAPLIGDNDDGKLINSGLLSIADHSYLIPSVSSKDIKNQTFIIDRYLLDGEVNLPDEKQTNHNSKYEEGGFYFLNNQNCKLMIRAGKLGCKGGHAHNDQLSFEMSIKGQKIFIDRGTYTYTSEPEMRNKFRSTKMHNVLQLNDFEQNSIGDLFILNDETQTVVNNFSENSFEGSHKGYRNYDHNEFSYSRKFSLQKNCLIIEDELNNLNNGDYVKIHFHLSPGLIASKVNGGIVVLYSDTKICYLKYDYMKYKVEILKEKHSPSYGVLVDALCIIIKSNVNRNKDSIKSIITICW